MRKKTQFLKTKEPQNERFTPRTFPLAHRILNGFHHPQHIIDPRVPRLSQLAREYRITGDHQTLARAMEGATEEIIGRKLHLNGPGIIAAIASDMGLSPEQIKGLLILSRTVSLIAHSIEENQREKPWRGSGRADITQPLDLSLQKPEYYDGPPRRSLHGDEKRGTRPF